MNRGIPECRFPLWRPWCGGWGGESVHPNSQEHQVGPRAGPSETTVSGSMGLTPSERLLVNRQTRQQLQTARFAGEERGPERLGSPNREQWGWDQARDPSAPWAAGRCTEGLRSQWPEDRKPRVWPLGHCLCCCPKDLMRVWVPTREQGCRREFPDEDRFVFLLVAQDWGGWSFWGGGMGRRASNSS